jgi:hypothetical protein
MTTTMKTMIMFVTAVAVVAVAGGWVGGQQQQHQSGVQVSIHARQPVGV